MLTVAVSASAATGSGVASSAERTRSATADASCEVVSAKRQPNSSPPMRAKKSAGLSCAIATRQNSMST